MSFVVVGLYDAWYGPTEQGWLKSSAILVAILSAVFAFSAISLPHSAQAQVASASISGTITGEGGDRLPGVQVTVENESTGFRTSVVTN